MRPLNFFSQFRLIVTSHPLLSRILTSSRTSTTTTFLSAARSVDRSSVGVTRGSEPGLVKDDIDATDVLGLRLGPLATAAAASASAAAARPRPRRRGTLLMGLARREETEERIVCDGSGGATGEGRAN